MTHENRTESVNNVIEHTGHLEVVKIKQIEKCDWLNLKISIEITQLSYPYRVTGLVVHLMQQQSSSVKPMMLI